MELFKQTNIDFLGKRNITLGISALLVIASLATLIARGGPKLGLDFRGGILVDVKFREMPPIDKVRSALSSKIPGEIQVQEATRTRELIIGTELASERSLEQARDNIEEILKQQFGGTGDKLDLNNANVASLADRLRSANVSLSEDEIQQVSRAILEFRDRQKSGLIESFDELSKVSGVSEEVRNVLRTQTALGNFNIRSVEIVGPRAGEELRRQAVLATLYALGGMLVYIAFRFELISGIAAVIATIHDVVITMGFLSWTGRELNLNVIAALLTLIGYSMNDKIVVFDRVRENLNLGRKGSFLDLVNLSINQTLSRTMLTAGPTLLATLALYFLGGEVLNGIAFALFVGIVVGTYSSIFVASAILVWWNEYKHGKAAARPAPAATSAAPKAPAAKAPSGKGSTSKAAR